MKIIQLLFIALIGLFTMSCNSSSSTKASAEVSKPELQTSGECESNTCCGDKVTETEKLVDITSAKVQVYYFHGTRRCATCQAVEKVTKETIAKNFLTDVGFVSINREKETALLEKFKISGQTLLVVSGDEVIDITSVAFLNARNHPEKLTMKLNELIKGFLK